MGGREEAVASVNQQSTCLVGLLRLAQGLREDRRECGPLVGPVALTLRLQVFICENVKSKSAVSVSLFDLSAQRPLLGSSFHCRQNELSTLGWTLLNIRACHQHQETPTGNLMPRILVCASGPEDGSTQASEMGPVFLLFSKQWNLVSAFWTGIHFTTEAISHPLLAVFVFSGGMERGLDKLCLTLARGQAF